MYCLLLCALCLGCHTSSVLPRHIVLITQTPSISSLFSQWEVPAGDQRIGREKSGYFFPLSSAGRTPPMKSQLLWLQSSPCPYRPRNGNGCPPLLPFSVQPSLIPSTVPIPLWGDISWQPLHLTPVEWILFSFEVPDYREWDLVSEAG